jgi:hypothetical protein
VSRPAAAVLREADCAHDTSTYNTDESRKLPDAARLSPTLIERQSKRLLDTSSLSLSLSLSLVITMPLALSRGVYPFQVAVVKTVFRIMARTCAKILNLKNLMSYVVSDLGGH